MNYSIKYAKKGLDTSWLEKSGNMYLVARYDMKDNKTIDREEFERFDDADRRFIALCTANGMEPTNIKHDPNNFRFD